MRRINAALLEVVAETIGRELSDPRLGFVTITAVEATPDLKAAKVFYTVLERRRRRSSQRALESAHGLVQARIAAALRTRSTPQLTFVYDEHQERAARLTRLIESAVPAEPGDAGDD